MNIDQIRVDAPDEVGELVTDGQPEKGAGPNPDAPGPAKPQPNSPLVDADSAVDTCLCANPVAVAEATHDSALPAATGGVA